MLTGQAPLCRAFRGAAGNKMMQGMKGHQRPHPCHLPGARPCSSWGVSGDNGSAREIMAVFPSCWVKHGQRNEFPPYLSAASSTGTLPAARRSLFITISLPPHLFDITYSVWKYCPFCPLLHHLLTQSRVCVWVRSSWHTQEVNTFTSPEIADSGRGGGGHAHAPEPHTPIAPQLRREAYHCPPR